MKLIFTKHILRDSSMRIRSKRVKSSEENIKKHFKSMFNQMWHSGKYLGCNCIMYHNMENESFKLVAGNHKLICKKNKDGDIVLITYARKTEIDRIEWKLLKIIRKSCNKSL